MTVPRCRAFTPTWPLMSGIAGPFRQDSDLADSARAASTTVTAERDPKERRWRSRVNSLAGLLVQVGDSVALLYYTAAGWLMQPISSAKDGRRSGLCCGGLRCQRPGIT